MRPAVTRCLAVLILASWVTPSVGALGLGLHLGLDHHGSHSAGSHGADHAREMSELVHMMMPGHHHDAEASSHHDHDLQVDVPPSTRKPRALSTTAMPAPAMVTASIVERLRAGGAPTRGGTTPLFTAHCALLL